MVDFVASNTDSCGALNVLFTNLSDPYNGHSQDSMSFVWMVQGDTSAITAPFDSTFLADSINNADIDYNILLIGTTQYGCVDSLPTIITIYPNPVAYIDTLNGNVTTNCAPFTIDNTVIDSVEYPNANDNYSWYITDASNNIILPAQPNVPLHIMNQDGDTAIVHLVTTNVHTCEPDTARVMFITAEDPIAIYDTLDLVGCHPFQASIASLSTPSGLTHSWFIDGVLQATTATTFNHTFINTSYTEDTTYQLQLVVEAGSSTLPCTDTTTHTITVHPKPLAQFTLSGDQCANDPFTTDASNSPYSPINSWEWDFGDTNSVPNATANTVGPHKHEYDSSGVWNVSLTIKDQNGCKDSISLPITIWPNPVAAFNYDYACYPDSLCTNSIIYFSDTASTLDALGGQLDSSFWVIDNVIYPELYSYTNSNFNTSWPTTGYHTIGHIVMSDNG